MINSDAVIELREFNRRARINKAKIVYEAIKSTLEDLKEYR
jgi:hypothetical protein